MNIKSKRRHHRKKKRLGPQDLEEANRILQYEDEEAIEGNVAKQARQQLQDLRYRGSRQAAALGPQVQG